MTAIDTGDASVSEWLAAHLPLPNVWLGVSVEDQAAADERIPLLLETPAAKRFLSCEPLLGGVDLTSVHFGDRFYANTLISNSSPPEDLVPNWPAIDWVIVGGESGPGARPMHPDWARSLRDQCKAAGVPFFFKQWGEWAPSGAGTDHKRGRMIGMFPDGELFDRIAMRTDGALATPMRRFGKKESGAVLDGRQHREFSK